MSSKARKYDRRDETLQFLRTLTVFRGLKEVQLLEIEASARTLLLPAGETLTLQNDDTNFVYVVFSGSIQSLVRGDLFTKEALAFYMRVTAVWSAEPSELILLPVTVFDSMPMTQQSVEDEVTRCMLRVQIAGAEIFTDLDRSVLSYLAMHCEFIALQRGGVIIREGEKTGVVYLIVSGSLEVFKEQADGTRRTIDILREGATVGEMAVLLNEPRSASVRAWRDSLLIKVPEHCIENLLHGNAAFMFRIAQALAERLKRTTSATVRTVPVKTIALVPCSGGPHLSAFCARLKLAFEMSGANTALLTPLAAATAAGGVPYSEWIQAREAACDYLLLPCDGDSTEWTKQSIQQADMVFFVCAPGSDHPSSVPQAPVEIARNNGVRTELVLLRDPGEAPTGTAAWLAQGRFPAHHHAVIDHSPDYERIVRRISGKAVGLVLSGGGARGLAHIGVIRAIREKGLPIDMIGGTSMGAVIAAQYAAGYDSARMLEVTRAAYLGRPEFSDFTLPFVSFRTGRATIQRLVRMFGDRQIEDLPVGYFCVSCNLSRAEVMIHDTGTVWTATRISCSIPGLLPPIPFRGDVLVDGGFLDNLPVDVMRKRISGPVVAADVSVEVDLSIDRELPMETSWSGISQLFRKLTRRPMLPNIVDVLMRTVEVGSVRDSRIGGSPADLYLKVPVGNTPVTKFGEIDRLVAAGYEYALQKLENWSPLENGRP